MPISAACPQCGNSYRVKDEFAGKKFQCRECQALVTVPSAAAPSAPSGDPWDDLDLDSFQDRGAADEFDSGEEYTAPSPRRRKKRRKKSHTGSGGAFNFGGRPVGVLAAIICECVLILFNLANIVLTIMIGNPQGACGSVFRILLEGGIILGLLEAQSATRWISIGLSALGIATGLLCGCAILAGAFARELQQALGDGAEIGLLVAFAFQIVIWIANIVALLLPSSAEYFD